MVARRRSRTGPRPVSGRAAQMPDLTTLGGRLRVLPEADVARIHGAALELLDQFGLSDAPGVVRGLVQAAGGRVTGEGRLCFPPDLVDRAVRGVRREVTLAGRSAGRDLVLAPGRVSVGTGGAAPMVMDLDTGLFRASSLADLYDAARLVDALDHIHFFSRSLVARDIEDDRALDINTCYAALAGTGKHVMVSASHPDHVADIAEMCHMVAGSAEAFAARPFLSLNVNHVAPPMRFSPEAAEVLVAAARAGIPCMINTFGQMGASSPVTMAGCLAQSHAETLAGLVVSWLAAPDTVAIYGARPMITDLRSGGMAGGSGEQALLTAAATQIARYLDLPNSTIAGATDSKTPDAQSGYEKAASVSMAAHAGANLITQAAGMQAGLMGVSFPAYVIDNDMLGAVLRGLAPIEVSDETLSPGAIADAIRAEGHFLGHPQTYARMTSDFLYPVLADRRPIEQWQEAGQTGIVKAATALARDILAAHYPATLDPATDRALRARFDIRLPEKRMHAA